MDFRVAVGFALVICCWVGAYALHKFREQLRKKYEFLLALSAMLVYQNFIIIKALSN